MNKEEIQEVLDELNTVRPEMLNDKGKRLFEAIMSIADERDLYHSIIKEVREYIMTELITEWDIKNDGCVSGSDLPADAITPILQILDKVDKENK